MSALIYVGQNDLKSLYAFCAPAQKGMDCNLEEVDVYGNTPLLKACYLGRVKCALILLRHGANIRALNYFGQNALTLATYSGNIALVQELLRYRSYADFNLSSIVPALCVAILYKNRDLIYFFRGLDNGGEEIKTAHGLRPEELHRMINGYTKRKLTHIII